MTSQTRGKPRILFGVTAAITAEAFLRGQLRYFASRGWEVHLISGEAGLENFIADEGQVKLHVVPLDRPPRVGDVRAIFRIFAAIRAVGPDVTIMSTPKMGLLGSLAAFCAGVPARIYLLHGYRAEGARGVGRYFLRFCERVACKVSSVVVPVSEGLRRKATDEGLAPATKLVMVNNGSANGLDLRRFHQPHEVDRALARTGFGLSLLDEVVVFVGRLTRDKGLQELPDVWRRIKLERPRARLLVAGPTEVIDDDDERALESLITSPDVAVLGHVTRVEDVYMAADALLVLSRREGLGMAILEAAACGVPAVAFEATGVTEAIVDGLTGEVCPRGDTSMVAQKMCQLLAEDDRRRQMGEAAAWRARNDYDAKDVWIGWGHLVDEIVRDAL